VAIAAAVAASGATSMGGSASIAGAGPPAQRRTGRGVRGGRAVGPSTARFVLKPSPAGAPQRGVRAAADPASGFRLPNKRQLVVVISGLQPLRGGPTFYLEWGGALCAVCVLLAWPVLLLHCELACSSLQLMLACA
jgi:hypothetical protein